MTRKVVFTERAQSDLAGLFDYLLPLAGDKTASAFVDKIYNHCLGFDIFPERGMRRDDIRQGVRLVGYRRHASIAFTVVQNEVIILRIFMPGEDISEDIQL
jgi:toxin ParE1/3/4